MTEAELIEKAAIRVGITSLMNQGAASCVYSEGCSGVTQEHLIAFAREIAVHCVAALSTAAPESGWRPIETAPKDGSEFIAIYGRQQNVMQIVRWNALHAFWQCKGEPVIGFTANATAWKPLPAAPTAGETL